LSEALSLQTIESAREFVPVDAVWPDSPFPAALAPILPADVKCTPEEMRAKIMALEERMLALPAEAEAEPGAPRRVELTVRHHFSPGIYMRELHIPKGVTLTGAIHKTEHLNILSQGLLSVWTEDGMKTLTASTVIKSMPGIKRVGFALEDSVWITVHHNPTEERDVEKLWDLLVTTRFEDVLPPAENQKSIEGGA
jgi:hypothetical protein